MILTERQAETELRRRGPEGRRQVLATFEECRELAALQAWIYEAEADREELAPGVLWSRFWLRFWLRFWRYFERRHASHIRWVQSVEANE